MMPSMETFIIRVWEPDDAGDTAVGLRGVVERVATRESIPFVGEANLIAVLRGAMAEESDPVVEIDTRPDRALRDRGD